MNEEGFPVSAAPYVPLNKSGSRTVDIGQAQNN